MLGLDASRASIFPRKYATLALLKAKSVEEVKKIIDVSWYGKLLVETQRLQARPSQSKSQQQAVFLSGCRKRGVEFKGGSLHDGFGSFDSLAVLESTLASLPVLQNTVPRDGFDGFGGFGGVVAVSVVTATPLKLNPPFLTS